MSIADGIEVVGRSASQQVADGLSRKILAGEIQPGERIRESVLAEALGLSRNTVREAVRLLQGSGLVRYNFNHGLTVWDPNDSEVVDVYRARIHLELAAVASLSDATDLSDIDAAFSRFQAALSTHDPRTIVEADLAIHHEIVRLLNSPRLETFYSQLMNELRYFLLVLSIGHREYDDTTDIEMEHALIIDALKSLDARKATEVLRSTNEMNRDAVRKILAERRRTL